jgi:hypothetical protein
MVSHFAPAFHNLGDMFRNPELHFPDSGNGFLTSELHFPSPEIGILPTK